MEYGSILNLIPLPMKCLYRRYENLIKKVINAEWSKVFNHTCLKEYLNDNYIISSISLLVITFKLIYVIL